MAKNGWNYLLRCVWRVYPPNPLLIAQPVTSGSLPVISGSLPVISGSLPVTSGVKKQRMGVEQQVGA